MSISANDLPLVHELPRGCDPLMTVDRLSRLGRVVFFDSSSRHATLGRYSFVAADPFRWICQPAGHDNPFDSLRRSMAEFRCETRSDLPPFQGGMAGLWGYDLNRSLERIPRPRFDEFQLPALAVGLYDVVVAFDHQSDQAWILSQGFPEQDSVRRMQRARRRLAAHRELLDTPASGGNGARASGRELISAARLAPQFASRAQGVTSSFSEHDYLRAVERAVDYVHAGDVFQVNLAQRLLCAQQGAPFELYRRLRESNPAPFSAYFDLGDHQLCSTSPERLLAVRGGCVEARPIKGTRARISRPEADLYSAADLQASTKDRAENVMIVDLLRNDLSKACTPNSIRVTQLCGLEHYAYVQHLVSVIEGELPDDKSALDVLEAAFPGGSITGAPKVRAMEIIAELEPVARGAYCGSLGYIGFDGTCDASILIRTVTASRGWCQMPVGGGIVSASNPRDEYEETWHKAAGMLRAMSTR